MSNYTKTTNFATKDSLASGNPNKIVKGTEINSEFDNIAVAVATKANTASPSLTGTVTAAALNVTGNLDVDGTLEFDSISGTGSVAVTDIADEDNMSSDSATKLATQQSIKAYVDSQVTAQDLDLTDGSTSISIDLDSETLSVLGGTGVTSTASGNGVTLAIDSTVTTLTGSQTLTNKTLTSPDVNTPDIDGGTIDGTVIGGATAAAGSFTTVGATGNITVGGTVDGRDVATDGTKLDGIEASADVTDTANVTAAGALMDSELTAIASVKALNQGVATGDSPTFAALTSTGEITANGGIALGDSDKATFGAGDDLQIYHDGSNSYIKDTGTGDLRIWADSPNIATAAGNKIFYGNNGSAELYTAGGAKRLSATATGIDVTGTVTSNDVNITDTTPNLKFTDTDGNHLANITQSGSHLYVDNDSTGNIRFRVDSNTERLTVNGTGIDVTGNMIADGVGIGTSSPAEPLHVKEGSSGITQRAGTIALIEGSGNTKVTVASGATSTGELLFGRSTDADAGRIIYDHNDNILQLWTNGSRAVDIDASGNVGIGTSSPSKDLHISTASDSDLGPVSLGIGGPNMGNARGAHITKDTSSPWDFTIQSSASASANTATIFKSSDAVETMRISSAGFVGIGTSSPTARLSLSNATNDSNGIKMQASGWGYYARSGINGTSGGKFIHSTNWNANTNAVDSSGHATTAIIQDATTGSVQFKTGATNVVPAEAMRIDSSGNVGIGTDSPSAGLHVVNTTLTSQLRTSNTTANSTTKYGSVVGSHYSNSEEPITGMLITSSSSVVGGSVSIGGGISSANAVNAIKFYTAANNTTLDGSERMRIDSSGRVGIGTSSPAEELHISGSVPKIQIQDSDGTNQYGQFFHSAGSTVIQSRNDANGGTIVFQKYNGTTVDETLRIDTSGNVLVGKSQSSSTTEGIQLVPAGAIYASRDGNLSGIFDRKTSDGTIIQIRKEGVAIGAVNVVNGNNLTIGGAVADHAGIQFGTNILIPESGGSATDNALDLGYAAGRFKNLYLSQGVYLGGTGAANKLEDYEEGTWTPVFKDSSGNSASAGTAVGTYVKIGSVVHVQGNLIDINTSGLTGGDSSLLTGLPFTIITASATRAHGSLQSNSVAFTEGTPYLQGNNGQVQAGFKFNKTGAAAQQIVVNAFTSGSADVFFSMSYQTTA